MREHLETEAGINPLEDRFKVGYIAAIKDFLNIDVEEMATDD